MSLSKDPSLGDWSLQPAASSEYTQPFISVSGSSSKNTPTSVPSQTGTSSSSQTERSPVGHVAGAMSEWKKASNDFPSHAKTTTPIALFFAYVVLGATGNMDTLEQHVGLFFISWVVWAIYGFNHPVENASLKHKLKVFLKYLSVLVLIIAAYCGIRFVYFEPSQDISTETVSSGSIMVEFNNK